MLKGDRRVYLKEKMAEARPVSTGLESQLCGRLGLEACSFQGLVAVSE